MEMSLVCAIKLLCNNIDIMAYIFFLLLRSRLLSASVEPRQ